MNKILCFSRLARFDKPIGILLLLWPTLSALWLASNGFPNTNILVVFIVGVEEDLFPSQMMISSREDLEEERRLFYVAITRAMKKLYLTYSSTRYRYGMLKDCEKSRFIKEISPAYLDFDNFNTNRSLVSNVLREKKRNLSPIKKISNKEQVLNNKNQTAQ